MVAQHTIKGLCAKAAADSRGGQTPPPCQSGGAPAPLTPPGFVRHEESSARVYGIAGRPSPVRATKNRAHMGPATLWPCGERARLQALKTVSGISAGPRICANA